jgi:hypothetical protein
VSIDWTGCGTTIGSASAQRGALVDTDTEADWRVEPGTIGTQNSTLCLANEHVVTNTCVACAAGQSNIAGDNPAGPNTACDTIAVLRLSEVAPNQTGSQDLIELTVLASGTVRDIIITQSGTTLATMPDVTVIAGDLVVIHINPAAGVTTELTTRSACADAACFSGAWDFNGGATGISYSRQVLAVVDPNGDNQDVAAFSNQTTTPAGYPTQLQAVQNLGDWFPANCGGSPCTDVSSPTANAVSIDWTGCGTTVGSASVQRNSAVDTDTNAGWFVTTGTLGVANP